jgi:hypothetical protein
MLPALVLTFASLLYRLFFILGGSHFAWATFSPLASIFLCSGLFFPKKRYAVWPALGVLLSDVLINAHCNVPLLDTSSRFLATRALLRPHRTSSDLPGHSTYSTV